TKRKVAEEQLRQSAQRTRRLLRAATVGLWEWNLLTDAVYFSPEWKRQLGFADDEIVNRFEEWQKRVHPEDVARALAAVDDFRNGRVRRYSVEIRMLHRDGFWRWILGEADLERNEKGEPVMMMGSQIDITERKHAELALAASELFAKATVDAVTAHICVLDRTGKIVTVNQAWRDIFDKNHAQEEKLNYYVGTNYLEICASASGADADAATSMAKGIRSVMEGRCDEFTLEYRCDSSTAQRWFVASVTRFHGDSGNILVAHEDLTARKLSETALREEKDRIASIVDSAMDAIVTVDDQQRILVFNEAAEQMFGCKAEDAMGQTLDRLLPQRCRQAHASHIRDFGNSGVSKRAMGQAGIVRAMRFDGTEFPIEASISRVMVGGRTQFTVVLRDISLRTSLEAQLRESQKMEAMGTLAGGIAHDFNNIVAAILGNAGLASKEIGTADDRARLRVNEITKAAARARSLIEQILTFSRRQPHSMQQVSLQPLVHEALALLRATLPAAVQLHHDLAVQALVVVGNATQIEQVVLNLCTNAWQAGAGEIWIKLEQRAVDLADDAHVLLGVPLGHYACLAVRDNGSGMDEGTQARIFEPFFTSKAIGQGTGLGLSVVHGIVTQHRGTITVQSQRGAGSTFMVLLPLVLADAPVKTLGVVPAPSPVPAGRGQHIVYVDDDESILFLAKSILENSGYRVTYCMSGELALEAITEIGGAIDLLVTDYNLTGMSGLDLVRKVREQGHGMAAVITSGFVTRELLDGGSRLKAVEVVSKPDTMAELRGLIDRLLRESGVW
ncbi:MAG: PAS domain S-box protein, partial [Rhodoferax sp.]|nr:PAS domain S-box protein [Rhodoferax sp.]